MKGSAETRSIELFASSVAHLGVMTLREHSRLLVGAMTLCVAIVLHIGSEHNTVPSAVTVGSTVVDIAGTIFMLDFTVVCASVPN